MMKRIRTQHGTSLTVEREEGPSPGKESYSVLRHWPGEGSHPTWLATFSTETAAERYAEELAAGRIGGRV
jgi:hypothetical protein